MIGGPAVVAKSKENTMANDIGSVKGVSGCSTALNTQRGEGAMKPSASGNTSPGNTKPPRPTDCSVPMPK